MAAVMALIFSYFARDTAAGDARSAEDSSEVAPSNEEEWLNLINMDCLISCVG